MSAEPRIHLLIPAAGSGSRAGTAIPKQYQELAGLPLVMHTLKALSRVAGVSTMGVVVSPDDDRMQALVQAAHGLAHVQVWPVGGATRAASVSAGLHKLAQMGAEAHDWVLVLETA